MEEMEGIEKVGKFHWTPNQIELIKIHDVRKKLYNN